MGSTGAMAAHMLCLLALVFSLGYSPTTVEGKGEWMGLDKLPHVNAPYITPKPWNVVKPTIRIPAADVKVYTTEESVLERRHDYKGVVIAAIGYRFDNSHKPIRRFEVLESLRSQAAQMGANTIVGLKMEENTPEPRFSDTELVMCGTAIYLDP